MRICYVASCLTVLILSGCQATVPSDLTEAERSTIESGTQKFWKAVEEKDWSGVAANYTEDAILMPPHSPPIQGRENIQAFFSEFPPVSNFVLRNEEAEGFGDLAYVRGKYSMTLHTEEGASVPDQGSYFEIRRRQSDGSWLISRDMFNTDVPQVEEIPTDAQEIE